MVFNFFGNLFGFRLNLLKIKVFWLGLLRNCKDEFFNFKWFKELFRVFGIYILYDEK